MHYFIDGYNLLFRLMPYSHEDLQNQRETIIYDLATKISLLNLDISIVFDATSQMGDRSRSHYRDLEILFTGEGETADEYILDEVKNSLHPEQETIVTSDKKLALQVRNRSAHTQSVEEFIFWINRVYKNKLRQLKKSKEVTPSSGAPPLPVNPLAALAKEAPLDSYTDYYTQIFESKWQDLIKEEQVQAEAFAAAHPPIKKRTPKKSRRSSNVQLPPNEVEGASTDMERWLKLFEKRLSDSESDFFA